MSPRLVFRTACRSDMTAFHMTRSDQQMYCRDLRRPPNPARRQHPRTPLGFGAQPWWDGVLQQVSERIGTMGLSGRKTVLDQAAEVAEALLPTIEAAVDTAREKAIPLLNEAREAAAPILAQGKEL